MDKKLILVCDDDNRVEELLMQSIAGIDLLKERFEIDFSRGRLEPAIRALEGRLKRARSGATDGYPEDDASIIDASAIIVIDYDLIGLDASITGERAAYLARCYSRCGLIVGLNQFPPYVEEHFDLTLKGHPESFADLNISSKSLGNPGLWEEPWAGFRPWYWPLLSNSYDRFEKCVADLAGHLDEPIFPFFGFTKDRSLNLPRSIFEYITKTDNPSNTTFRKFVADSGNGLQRKDQPFSEEAIARIAVSRLQNWLENMLLPGQDILVDAPHLVSRYSSLLQGDPNDVTLLNRLASFAGNEALVLSPVIDEFRFLREEWLSRFAWFWSDISNSEKVAEVSDPWSVKKSEYVFCEDISRFIPQNSAKGFVANLSSPFVRRFLQLLEGIEYTPRVRLSL